ncbi:hypothetical protein [Paraburkholderia sp. J63]|uniref:hypothetical protein n=1 Tax=Paraburkholderia sp. J63 TaxID=2805434 RepID=UPI002ABD9BB1|nr:hypothetical protein [Paraburkholderia sp. J63]
MNKRKACLVGLAAGATLLAGCVAQYQNPSACEQEMRTRLGNASLGELSVTHTAVSYRGKRVVVEGTLARGALPASGVLSASAASAVSGAPVVSTVGASGAPVAPASTVASTAQHGVPASGVPAVSAASGASAASAASASSAPVAESKPTTPMAALAVKLGLHKAPPPSTAAECTYDKTGSLLSFRWLSPAALAKTTPAPGADDE